MARHFIKDGRGKDMRTSKGERLFWSDKDGDRRDNQTVYREGKGFLVGSSKIKGKYDPFKGRFK